MPLTSAIEMIAGGGGAQSNLSFAWLNPPRARTGAIAQGKPLRKMMWYVREGNAHHPLPARSPEMHLLSLLSLKPPVSRARRAVLHHTHVTN